MAKNGCTVCPPLRMQGRKCRHVEAQAAKAREALETAKQALEKLAKSQIEALRHERDEYRKIIDSLLGQPKRLNGEDEAFKREALRKRIEERKAAQSEQKSLPLP